TLPPRQAVQRGRRGHAASWQRRRGKVMSRDAFSYDPRDTREATPRRSTQQGPAPRAETRDSGDDAPEIAGRSRATEGREQPSGSDDRGAASRAYYVRDRAYLLRNSEIHSL